MRNHNYECTFLALTLINLLLTIFIYIDFAIASPSDVYIDTGKNILMVTKPDETSKPFVIKGLSWAPATKAPQYGPNLLDPSRSVEYGFFWDWPRRNPQGYELLNYWLKNQLTANYSTDISLMRQMNVNTVRIYHSLGSSIEDYTLIVSNITKVLDALYNNGNNSIMVIMTVAMSKQDLDSGRYLDVVNSYKNHPAILMWAIGNEWNLTTFYGYATVEEAGAAVNQAAQKIKGIDIHHPVSSVLGDAFTVPSSTAWIIKDVIQQCPDIDIWGLNVYRGESFGNLFQQWGDLWTQLQKLSKPFYISEFGIDSYNTTSYTADGDSQIRATKVSGSHDQQKQSDVDLTLWREIKTHLSSQVDNELCVGGLIHEFNDELWKVGNYHVGLGGLVDYAVDHSYDDYNNEGFVLQGGSPDNVLNEEYFGIVNSNREPKLAYQNMKIEWAPQVGTITPSSGSSSPGQLVDFNTTYSAVVDWQDIAQVHFIINTSVTGVNGFYAYYDQTTNKLYLRDNTGTTWLGGYAPGASNVIENSYAKLDCYATTVSGSGSTMTVHWMVGLKSTFTGTKNTYLYVKDNSNAASGWKQVGTWTIANNAPQVGTITPSSGSSSANQGVNFSTTFYDPDGWQNIAQAHFIINTAITGSNGFYAYYDQNTNKLYLRDNGGTTWLGGYAPGSSNVIENSYVKLDCASTTVQGNTGGTMTVNWSVVFKSTFSGAKNTYLYVRDDSTAASGWKQVGSWTIISAIPQVKTITPSSGSSSPEQLVDFNTTFSAVVDWRDIAQAHFITNTSVTGVNGFYAYYDQNTNKLYLRDNSGTTWLGGYAPGSSNVIENSYAKLDCTYSSVQGSGNTMTIHWMVAFKSAFTGAKNTYLYVKDDYNAASGWKQVGTWTIVNNPPQVGTITPSSGSSSANQGVNFSTTFYDPDRWQNIAQAHFIINTSITGVKGFYAYYDQNTNKLYLRDNTGTVWLGGYAPGSSTVIENSYVKLDCASTTLQGNTGGTVTVNWSVAFKSAFTGTKNTYLYVRDDSNAASGWKQVGNWTIQ